jgi:hypothetical protein
MVKNGLKSSFVYWSLIWACFVGKSRPLKDDKPEAHARAKISIEAGLAKTITWFRRKNT